MTESNVIALRKANDNQGGGAQAKNLEPELLKIMREHGMEDIKQRCLFNMHGSYSADAVYLEASRAAMINAMAVISTLPREKKFHLLEELTMLINKIINE